MAGPGRREAAPGRLVGDVESYAVNWRYAKPLSRPPEGLRPAARCGLFEILGALGCGHDVEGFAPHLGAPGVLLREPRAVAQLALVEGEGLHQVVLADDRLLAREVGHVVVVAHDDGLFRT